jgi:hypothetical protein
MLLARLPWKYAPTGVPRLALVPRFEPLRREKHAAWVFDESASLVARNSSIASSRYGLGRMGVPSEAGLRWRESAGSSTPPADVPVTYLAQPRLDRSGGPRSPVWVRGRQSVGSVTRQTGTAVHHPRLEKRRCQRLQICSSCPPWPFSTPCIWPEEPRAFRVLPKRLWATVGQSPPPRRLFSNMGGASPPPFRAGDSHDDCRKARRGCGFLRGVA